MMTCAELTAYWDQAIDRFLAGGPAVPPDPRMRSWAEAYRGRGRGAVNLHALPEPYLGALDRQPVGVFLALNPGQAVLDFQGRWGLFADEIRRHGTYLSVGGDLAIPAGPVGRGDGPQPSPHLPPEIPADLDRPANPDRRRNGLLRAVPLA